MGPAKKRRHRGAGPGCSVNLLHGAVLRTVPAGAHGELEDGRRGFRVVVGAVVIVRSYNSAMPSGVRRRQRR